MKSAHPNWRLAYYLLPPISLSLIFTVFFPTLIFQVLVGLVVVSLIPTLWLGINTLKNVTFLGALSNVTVFPSFLSHSKNLMGATQWLFSILGLIFLLGMSGISLSVLTAASQLAPDLLTWGSVTKIWRISFPIGFSFLIAHVILNCFQLQKPNALRIQFSKKIGRENTKKLLLTLQQFVGFSGFAVFAISLMIVIMSIASGLARAVDFEIRMGATLQTIIGCTLLYLPWTMKRFNRRRALKKIGNPTKKFLKVTCSLIFWVIVLSLLTLPFAGFPIKLLFIHDGLIQIEWQLFIVGWWISLTPFIAMQVTQLSMQRPLRHTLMLLIVGGIFVYTIGVCFLSTLGENYFLAVIRENWVATLLGTVPIGVLALNGLRFQQLTETIFSQPEVKKHARNEKYFVDSLVKGMVIACSLYWLSGLSILSPILLMVTVPTLVLFLLIVFCAARGITGCG